MNRLELLESFYWDYLVKVKLKNLEDLLKAQKWTDVEGLKDVAICEFNYRAKSWQCSRMLKATRSVKEYVEVSYLGIGQNLGCMSIIFIKLTGKSLTGSSKQHKNKQRKEVNMRTNTRVYGRGVPSNSSKTG